MAERSAKQLGLSKADLPNSIIEVIATLTKSGYEAYIVGGGVRDNLLGLDPKDFDAVTDAKPHEVKDLFGKRCRVIGRRFQLAHVYSGRDMIEVATFRAPPNGDAHTTNDGMIVRDNVWGDIEQDFVRRDFSINALYYEPLKGIVHDFCDALGDIESKTLRLLGNAPVRIEEDPVRLLRALRFKAKLGFDFDRELSKQFHDDNWSLLDQVSPHRLYDESQKMFTGGYLVPLLPLLFEYGAIRHLIIYPPEAPTALVTQVAVNTDKRIGQGKSINPAFFYAALLWDNYLYQLAKLKKKNMPFHDAQLQAASIVIDRQRIKTAIPKFAEQFIRDIWLMQPKLANPRVKQITQLAEHPRFRAAFDFLLLREQCDDESNPLSESTNGMGEWWQTYQTLSEKQKQQAIDDFGGDARRGSSKRSRGRNRNRNRDDDYNDAANQVSNQAANDNVKSSRQSDHKPMRARQPKSPDTATQHSQNTQFAQEREQLQRLSLGELAGEQHAAQLAKPLFTIDAAKMAKQVPLQKKAEEAAAKAQTQAKAPAADRKQPPAQHKQPAVQNDQPAANGKPVNNVKPAAKAKPAAAKRPNGGSNNEAVLLPKVDTVPSKRRRRLPTSEVTQVELAKQAANSAAKPVDNAQVDSHAEVAKAAPTKKPAPAKKPAPTKKPASNAKAKTGNTATNSAKAKNAELDAAQAQQNEANSKAKSAAKQQPKPATEANSQPADNSVAKSETKPVPARRSRKAASPTKPSTPAQIATGVVKNSERVPATRRRRAPTSEQTVKERLATES